MTESYNHDINDSINDMIEKLIKTLNANTKEAIVGASAMICLLVHAAMDNGHPKEMWLEDIGEAWDFYKKEKEKCVHVESADQTKAT